MRRQPCPVRHDKGPDRIQRFPSPPHRAPPTTTPPGLFRQPQLRLDSVFCSRGVGWRCGRWMRWDYHDLVFPLNTFDYKCSVLSCVGYKNLLIKTYSKLRIKKIMNSKSLLERCGACVCMQRCPARQKNERRTSVEKLQVCHRNTRKRAKKMKFPSRYSGRAGNSAENSLRC